MIELTGAQAAAKAIIAENVNTVFTLADGSILSILDGLIDGGVEVIDVRHEQAAGNAADGWGRVTRTPGVCLVAMGPGLVNLLPALAQAFHAGSPVVAITGAAPLNLYEMDAFEDIDAVKMVEPFTKWAARCMTAEKVTKYVRLAFSHAMSGKKGPVLLEIPKDVQLDTCSTKDSSPVDYRPSDGSTGSISAIKKAVELLAGAERPVILAGSGVYWSGASKELVELAEMMKTPVACEFLGLGCIPQSHDLSIGNAVLATPFMRQADVMVTVGARFDSFLGYGIDSSTYAEDVKMVHIDIDSSVIGKNRPIDVGINGDAKQVLSSMLAYAKTAGVSRTDTAFADQVKVGYQMMNEAFDEEANPEEVPIRPHRLMRELREFAKPESMFVIDGGDTTAWSFLYLRAEFPGQIIGAQGPLGHLGAGLPICMAAKRAHPERDIYLVSGDGSFFFNGVELETAVRREIPVITVVCNDLAWGLVYHTRKIKTGSEELARRGTIINEHVKLDLFAQSLGAYGETVTETKEIKPALQRALDSGKPAVVDVRVSREFESLVTQVLAATPEG
ncbi:MAG: thiamine pyrophosphate-binding protein [Candidatus Thorarchaeota archaeon]